MSTASAPTVNKLAGMPRNMIPDLGWFDSDQTKFEDLWRGIKLFLKSNRVTGMDNRITAILAHLRGGVVDIYVQKKLNIELNKETNT